jgi:hypothetical protein
MRSVRDRLKFYREQRKQAKSKGYKALAEYYTNRINKLTKVSK